MRCGKAVDNSSSCRPGTMAITRLSGATVFRRSRACSLLVWPSEQQVAVSSQAENVQAKGPEPGAQAADMLGQVAPGVPLHRLFRRSAEQVSDRDALSGALEYRLQQAVHTRRTGNDHLIKDN